MTIQNLFDRLHTAQETHNAPASEAFRRSIEAFNRGDVPSAEYWRLLGEFEFASSAHVRKTLVFASDTIPQHADSIGL